MTVFGAVPCGHPFRHEDSWKLVASLVPTDRDRLPNPMKAMFQKVKQSNVWQTIKRTRARWSEEDGDQRAAAFAYYLLLSILPLTLLLMAVASFFVEHEEATQAIVKLVHHYVPLTSEQERGAMENVREWLNARGKISLTMLPFLLWGSMKYLRTLIRTTNRIWHAPPYSWWRLPLKSLGLLGITASAVLIGILLPAAAGLATNLDFPQWAFAMVFQLIPGLVLFYGLIMIYKLAPGRPTRFAEVWLGALAVTVVLWLGQRLFLDFAANLANFDALYGALGGIMAFLLLLYLSSCVGVAGICFSAARAEMRGQGRGQPE